MSVIKKSTEAGKVCYEKFAQLWAKKSHTNKIFDKNNWIVTCLMSPVLATMCSLTVYKNKVNAQ